MVEAVLCPCVDINVEFVRALTRVTAKMNLTVGLLVFFFLIPMTWDEL